MPTLDSTWFRGRAKSEEPPRDRQLREHFNKLKPRSDTERKAREFLSTPKKKTTRPANNHHDMTTKSQAPNSQPMARRTLLPEVVQNESLRPKRAASLPLRRPCDVRLPSLPGGKTAHPNRVRPRDNHSYNEYIRPLSRSRTLPPVPRRTNQVDASELRALKDTTTLLLRYPATLRPLHHSPVAHKFS